ncbi:hypothetical protein VNO77_46386 [Canavalia gladiata]
MPTHFDSREKPRKWKSDQRPGPSGPERQIFVAVLKLALSPLYFHYWTEFASDDANLIPFFQQGPLRLSSRVEDAQTLPIVRLVDEIGVPGEEEEKEDLNRKLIEKKAFPLSCPSHGPSLNFDRWKLMLSGLRACSKLLIFSLIPMP